MDDATKTQRRRSNRKSADAAVIRIQLKDGMGNPRWATADLVNLSETGCGLSLMTPLKAGSILLVRGKLGENRSAESLRTSVRWCIERTDGTYLAGLEFLDREATSESDEQQQPPANPEVLDCYEVMQLSPNADSDTIGRVYRVLATRFHPDNAETGNTEMFVRLCEAYQILSDPEKRARYDVQHRETQRLRWKIFDQASASAGTEGERRKRQGILALLYAKTLRDPEQAEMNVQLFEELLGCPREHLQAALWYLRGKNFIKRTDNGRYSITIAGFDEAESSHATPISPDHQLMEPGQ